MIVKTRFVVFADLALLALDAVNVTAVAMAETCAAAASVHSLIRVWPGRHLHGESGVAMTLLTASSHVAQADKTARCSDKTEAGFGQADIGSSSLGLGIAVANAAAAVSDPAAVRRQIAVVETSVGIAMFAGIGAFAVSAAGSSAAVAVLEERIVVDGWNLDAHVAATGPGPDGSAADSAVTVDLRRKVRPWVAVAASGRPRSTSAPGRTPRTAHSRPVDRPRMEAA
jgi:hypothetical protein